MEAASSQPPNQNFGMKRLSPQSTPEITCGNLTHPLLLSPLKSQYSRDGYGTQVMPGDQSELVLLP